MSHLILHIGLHKTGTSSLQHLCFGRAEDLARHGLIYPRLTSAAYPEGVPGHHGLLLNLARYFPQYMPEGGSEAAWARIARDHGAHRVLISSEEFSRGRAHARVNMVRLAEIAQAWDKVTVVCVLREQVSFLQSVFVQMSAVGQLAHLENLIDSIKGNDSGGLWTDWRPLIDHLLTGFAADDLHFIDYHHAKATPGGVLGSILALGNVTYRPAAKNSTQVNASAPPLAQRLCHPHFLHKPIPRQAIDAVQAVIDARFGAGRPACVFTRAEVAMIQSHFRDANTELVARIRTQQPDFALSDAHLPDNMLYREDVEPFASDILSEAGIGSTSPKAAL